METTVMTDELNMDELLAQAPEAKPGTVVEGTVVSQSEQSLLIDIGLKQEASLAIREFHGALPAVGSKVQVLIIRAGGPDGRPIVSWKQARERANWEKLATAKEQNSTVDGRITRRVKGGVSVDIGLDAFMPASQIDERPVAKPEDWVGKAVRVQILEMDRTKGNVLVSRRKVVEQERAAIRTKTLEGLEVGQTRTGRVVSLTNFGAFVDIGGLEGLLHISDISWSKIDNPKQALKLGDEIDVKILKFARESQRVSLGRKQLLPHPWEGIETRFPVGASATGKVTGFAAFGAFVEVAPGVEGLIHLSELSWTDHVKNPKDLLKLGQEVDTKVIGLDRAQEKMSLSLKRMGGANPWEEAARAFPAGTAVEGEVTGVAPFGVFVRVAPGIEGLIRNQDFSWTGRPGQPSDAFKPGDKIKAAVLNFDVEKEKLSLGVKQLSGDPMRTLRVGQAVTGTVSGVTDFGVFVKLESGIEGLIRMSDLQPRRSTFDATEKRPMGGGKSSASEYKQGDKVTAMIVKIDKKDRKIDLSVRRYERDQEKELLKKYSSESGRPTLGEATGWLDSFPEK